MISFLKHTHKLLCIKDLLLSSLILLIISTSVGQTDNKNFNEEVLHWTVEDGLSHRNVRGIFQDSRGFMWIGTAYGLNRFDGYQFKVFSKEKNGLASNEVVFIEEDDEGWLWLASDLDYNRNRNLTFINVYTNEIYTVQKRFGNNFPININKLERIRSDEARAIYFCGGGKIYRYRNKKFKLLLDCKSQVYITDCKDGKLLGFKRINPDTIETFELINDYYNPIGKFKTVLSSGIQLFYDYNKDIWIDTKNEIYKKRKGKAEWQLQQLSKLTGKNISQSNQVLFSQNNSKFKGIVWCYGDNNLNAFQIDGDFKIDIGKQYPNIPKANIKGIYFDRFDNAWLETAMGLYKIKITKNHFKNYLNKPLENFNIKNTFSCRGITLTDGKLWVNSVGSEQFLIDLKKNSVENLTIPAELIISPKEKPILFPIIQTDDSSYYTSDSHIIKYINGKPSAVYYWKSGEPVTNSWSLFENQGKIWMGLWERGLAVLDNDSIVLYRKLNGFKAISESEVYHFYKWDENNILIATSKGIFAMHPQKGIIQRFWTGGNKETYIPSDIIYHINRDNENENILWVATSGAGLLKLNLDTSGLKINGLEQFTTIDGLSSNILYAVYNDNYHNLWIPGDYGLMRFNKTTNKCKSFTTADGLPANEFNRIAHYQAADGQLFFGTINGITTFNPKDLTGINHVFNQPLRITRLLQYNGDESKLQDRTAELVLKRKIILQPKDKFLILNFSLLEYADASKIKYSYQLSGQDDQWIYLNDNEIHLNGLPYGNLTLNVRAQGESGQFSLQTLSIPITVKRPFYLTWGFLILIIFVLVASYNIFYRFRTRALYERQKELEREIDSRTIKIKEDKEIIEKQAEELKNLDKLKSRFFTNISHELRTPLTLILAPVREILSKNKLGLKATVNLRHIEKNCLKIQRMVNDILDLAKLESDNMEIHLVTVNPYQFLKRVYASFESVANMKSIEYRFLFTGNKKQNVIIDSQKVEIVLNNLLSNAFKFTPNRGLVHFHAIATEQLLTVEIKDTGCGIAEDDLPNIFNRFYQSSNNKYITEGGTGIGLALSNEIVSLLNGTITVESQQHELTVFKLQLPFKIDNNSYVDQSQKDFTLVRNEQIPKTLELSAKGETVEDLFDGILVVEDNPDLSSFIKSILEEFYPVITAKNGEDALEKLAAYPDIKLIVSDIMMPVMDGYELLEQLKTSDRWRDIPVIMLTARANLKDKLMALRIGVDDYLSKPFVKEELLARIDNLLRNARGRKKAQLKELENSAKTKHENEPEVGNIYDKEKQEWLDNLEQIIQKNIAYSNFTADKLAAEMFTSERQLYRKIQQYIGTTPLSYIKDYKLNYALDLLENKKVNSVKSAAYAVGYTNMAYFRRVFKKAFGQPPSYYLD